MVHGGNNVQVIVVQDQSLDIGHLVEGLALYLLDLVVGQINHLQLCPVVPDAKQVPGQPLELVPLEDQDLGLGGDVLQYEGSVNPVLVQFVMNTFLSDFQAFTGNSEKA